MIFNCENTTNNNIVRYMGVEAIDFSLLSHADWLDLAAKFFASLIIDEIEKFAAIPSE